MDDYNYIKKHYSESMAKVCRGLFPTLLETKGLLSQILESRFGHSSSIGDDLASNKEAQENFKDFVYSFVDVEKEKPTVIENKNPFELMREAGYILFPECMTEKDIQSYRHYYYRNGETPVYVEGQDPEYRQGEELCTFNGGRLDSCRVWFAVKENVDEIRRENFKNPTRQDKYGTSVISLQFTKDGRPTLSIKNRYNHTVNRPDATFGNNLENIIPGLTQAWVTYFGLNISCEDFVNFELYGYRQANDGKFYRENNEIDNVSYCENNVIIDNGNVVKLDKSYMMLVDNYIFDSKNKRVISYKTYKREQETGLIVENADKEDPFIASLGDVKGFRFEKGKDGERTAFIKVDGGEEVQVTFGKHNEILGVVNPNVTEIQDSFLSSSYSIREISMPNVKTIGSGFCCDSEEISKIDLPKVESIGNEFLCFGSLVKTLDLPMVKEIGSSCCNGGIFSKINMPNLERIDYGCFVGRVSGQFTGGLLYKCIKETNKEEAFYSNPVQYFAAFAERYGFGEHAIFKMDLEKMEVINLPKLESIGHCCFGGFDVKKFVAPQLNEVGEGCFAGNEKIDFECGVEVCQEDMVEIPPEDEQLYEDCKRAVKDYHIQLNGGKVESQEGQTGFSDAKSFETETKEKPLSGDALSEDALRDLKAYMKLESGEQPNQDVSSTANLDNE